MEGARPEGTVFTCSVEVRWADLDLLGHVNNTKYFEYTMEARVQFYRESVFRRDGDAGAAMVLRKVDMEYLRPVVMESGPLEVDTTVRHVGNTSYSLTHTLRDVHGEICAIGTAVMVGWDRKAQKSRPLTEAERTALAAYLPLTD